MSHDLILGRHPLNWHRDDSDQIGAEDPWFWTPAAIRSEMARIRNVLDTVNQEVTQATTDKIISPQEWDRWRQAYLAAHKFVTSASNMWGNNVTTARIHEEEALKWHELIIKRGGTTLGPALGKPKGTWLNTTTAVLAVGGIASVAYLVNAIRRK